MENICILSCLYLLACILGPGEHEEIEIFFHPSGTEEYSCLIPFEINGLYTVHIRLEGEGTIPKGM